MLSLFEAVVDMIFTKFLLDVPLENEFFWSPKEQMIIKLSQVTRQTHCASQLWHMYAVFPEKQKENGGMSDMLEGRYSIGCGLLLIRSSIWRGAG